MTHVGHDGFRIRGRVRGTTSIRVTLHTRDTIDVSHPVRDTIDIHARPTTSRPSPHARGSHTRTVGNNGSFRRRIDR